MQDGAPPNFCGKRTYGSEREALEVAAYRMTQEDVTLTAYHCLDCGCWHLTSSTRR